jgi:hypothetical protein
MTLHLETWRLNKSRFRAGPFSSVVAAASVFLASEGTELRGA